MTGHRPVEPESCPLQRCDGSGFVIDEATNTATDCACRAQRISRARARAISGVIPRKYRGVSFDRPPITLISPPVVSVVRRFVETIDANIDAGRGLWFSGSVGTGKTTLAMLVSKAAMDAGHSVAIYALPRLLTMIRSTFDDADGPSYLDLFDQLCTVDLLHIDDIGAEKTTPWVLEQLYALVDKRYQDERPMVITTNLDHVELGKQIGERTASRLMEMCDVLPLLGPDARAGR